MHALRHDATRQDSQHTGGSMNFSPMPREGIVIHTRVLIIGYSVDRRSTCTVDFGIPFQRDIRPAVVARLPEVQAQMDTLRKHYPVVEVMGVRYS